MIDKLEMSPIIHYCFVLAVLTLKGLLAGLVVNPSLSYATKVYIKRPTVYVTLYLCAKLSLISSESGWLHPFVLFILGNSFFLSQIQEKEITFKCVTVKNN